MGLRHDPCRDFHVAAQPPDLGFLIRAENLTYADALLVVGIAVLIASSLVFLVRFSRETERAERQVLDNALAARANGALAPGAAD